MEAERKEPSLCSNFRPYCVQFLFTASRVERKGPSLRSGTKRTVPPFQKKVFANWTANSFIAMI